MFLSFRYVGNYSTRNRPRNFVSGVSRNGLQVRLSIHESQLKLNSFHESRAFSPSIIHMIRVTWCAARMLTEPKARVVITQSMYSHSCSKNRTSHRCLYQKKQSWDIWPRTSCKDSKQTPQLLLLFYVERFLLMIFVVCRSKKCNPEPNVKTTEHVQDIHKSP